MIDPEFIKRAEEFAKPLYEKIALRDRYIRSKWKIEKPDEFKKSQKKYNKTEKARSSRKKFTSMRYRALKYAIENSTKEEWHAICDFYINVPNGYVVDHIIPISEGGKHEAKNLQYLTLAENSSKGKKLIWDRQKFYKTKNIIENLHDK